MRNRHHYIWILAIAALALAGCGADSGADSGANGTEQQSTEEQAAVVRTLAIEATEVTDTAVLSADLEPYRRATLAAEVAGTVETLTVDVGDRAPLGKTLCTIDTRALTQQIAEAEALYRQAQDRFERAERLFAKRSITKEQHIDAVASRDVAEARLASAQLELDKSRVKSPWSGRISARHVEIGDYAAPGQPLLEIVAIDRIKVKAAASAADVPYLEVGAPVEVTLDIFPDETFSGTVVRLGAELDPSTRTLDVEAVLDNREGRLKPGFFGRLAVPRRVIPDAVLVPIDSIIDFEDHRAVYVVEGDEARRRRVELGPMIGDSVVVTSGVEDGERVIIAGLQQVVDGARISEEGDV